MSEQYESMMEGLTDLLEYVKGDRTKGRVRAVEAERGETISFTMAELESLEDIDTGAALAFIQTRRKEAKR